MKSMSCITRFVVGTLLVASLSSVAADESIPYPGPAVSAAKITAGDGGWVVGNNAIAAVFTRNGDAIRLVGLRNERTGEKLALNDASLFTIRVGGKSITSSAMKMIQEPRAASLRGDAKLARLSERLDGGALRAVFEDPATGLRAAWSAVLRDGSAYLRQELSVSATKPVSVDDIEMLHVDIPGAKLAGYTDGSPVVAGNWFLGMEHPMAKTGLAGGSGWTPQDMRARGFARRVAGLSPGPLTVRFNYTGGPHRIDVTKVELVVNGEAVFRDDHAGFAGIPSKDNVYTLTIPPGVTSADIRVTIGGVASETDSNGTLVLSQGEIVAQSAVIASLPRRMTLEPGQSWSISTGIGVAPAGQMRRAFACYLQRERAHPYRQYWHYNSWYDLNIGRNDDADPLKRMNEAECMKVEEAFDAELFKARGVGLNGFVWDDGWDDWNSLWQFHAGFPNGFAKLNELARKQGAGMGAWLSPWGGYGRSHDMRVKLGREKGYETNPGGFSLGGAKYYAAFRDTCVKMIRDYGQNYFKFDGIGGGVFATGAPAGIAPDLDGLVRLIGDLRRENPDIFINCTVGTWASPYWTWFADSVWRQGADSDFSGKGNQRERWINYKDSLVYDRFVSKSPLFPVNSLMYHGVLLGPTQNPGRMPPPAKDPAGFAHEVRMAVGYSSGLGELYITPRLMTPEAWDILAECIRFARAHKATVVDSHWIGGDPRKNEPYGFAAWHPVDGGVITLRNPDDQPHNFALDVGTAFELPAGAATKYVLRCPWKDGAGRAPIAASAGAPVELTLQPFDVITLEARPATE